MTSIDTTRGKLARLIFDAPAQVAWNGQQHAIADAILAEFVVIPRSELPKRAPEAALELLTAAGHTSTSHGDPDHVLLGEAIRCLDAWADRLIAEAKRNVRRDELAIELYQSSARFTYAGATTTVQRASDRIIDVEGRLAVYGEQA